MEDVLAAQRRYFDSGATRPLRFRREMLTRLELALTRWEGELLEALKADLNKSPYEGYMSELGPTLAELRFARGHLKKWARPVRHPAPLSQFPSVGTVYREPYGVSLILAPWNYPLLLTLAPLVSAIAAGCTAVVKPGEDAPASARALAEVLGRVFPPDYITVAEGGREEAEALVDKPFDVIFFTGSPAVGKKVMAAAAEHLTPVTLELGGKSPVIVDRTANLPLTARRLAFGKILNAGQTCVAPDYCLVDRTVRDRLVEELKKQFQKMLGEDPLANRDFVRIINRKHYNRLQGLLEGENLLYGGGHRDDPDSDSGWIAPTLVADTLEGTSKPMGEEIFGPILPIIPYDTLDQAIDFIRQREKPLALYLFTQSRKTKERILNTCSFGGGCVNDTIIHLATHHMPFGGVGQSGMGSYHGKKSFETFSHYRSIVDKATWLDLPMRYQPYTKLNNLLVRMFIH